jgi:hypothetical protein
MEGPPVDIGPMTPPPFTPYSLSGGDPSARLPRADRVDKGGSLRIFRAYDSPVDGRFLPHTQPVVWEHFNTPFWRDHSDRWGVGEGRRVYNIIFPNHVPNGQPVFGGSGTGSRGGWTVVPILRPHWDILSGDGADGRTVDAPYPPCDPPVQGRNRVIPVHSPEGRLYRRPSVVQR